MGITKSYVLIFIVGLLISFTCIAQQPIDVVKTLPLGSVVTISGTITTGSEWGTIRYMQDHSGGIGLFSTSLAATRAGDSLSVTGVLSSYRGQLQISPVLSFQHIGSNTNFATTVVNVFDSATVTVHNSEMVTLFCPGVQTCEITYAPGTVVFYDQHGNCITAEVSEVDHLAGKPIYKEHAFVTGVLYTLDGQPRLLIDSLAPQGSCDNLHPPVFYFMDMNNGFSMESLPSRQTYLQWGQDSFTQSYDLAIPSQTYDFVLGGLPAGALYTFRIQQIDEQDTFYSKLIHFTPALSGEPIEVFFNRSIDASFSDGSSPKAVGGTVIEQDLIRRIDSVSATLDIAMYNTGRDPIVQAINRAVDRGVAVRYIADDETSNAALDEADFPVFYRTGDGIMHHKFVIGDVADSSRAWLWTGSTNLSSNQLNTDPNHAYVIRNKALALTYKSEFDELWGTQGNHQDSRVGEVKDDNTCHLFKHNNTLIESYFSPSDETECHISEAINSADHQLLIGLLLLTSDVLINFIVDMHESGVEVRVILEDRESSSYAANRLEQAGVPFAIHDPGPIYHHKIAIIDEGHIDSDPTVVTGSHNWTWSADHINDENTLIIHDQSIANIFRQEFEARWDELDPVATHEGTTASIQIFPNPVTSFVTVTNLIGRELDVKLYDACGKLCQAGAIASDRTVMEWQINPALPNGIYTIRFADGTQWYTKKMVVLR
jgi:phosphatidylserine/phosphatidylglycerophosphate/cardiolipin synthase-like enzyme